MWCIGDTLKYLDDKFLYLFVITQTKKNIKRNYTISYTLTYYILVIELLCYHFMYLDIFFELLVMIYN